MCEPLTPIDALEQMKWSISALCKLTTQGSYEARNLESATDGIRHEINWIIAQLKAANEGRKNMGAFELVLVES